MKKRSGSRRFTICYDVIIEEKTWMGAYKGKGA